MSHVRQRSAANLSLFGSKDNFVFTSILLIFRGAGEVLIVMRNFMAVYFHLKRGEESNMKTTEVA
jgi:hypothetical protein